MRPQSCCRCQLSPPAQPQGPRRASHVAPLAPPPALALPMTLPVLALAMAPPTLALLALALALPALAPVQVLMVPPTLALAMASPALALPALALVLALPALALPAPALALPALALALLALAPPQRSGRRLAALPSASMSCVPQPPGPRHAWPVAPAPPPPPPRLRTRRSGRPPRSLSPPAARQPRCPIPDVFV